MGVGEQGLAVGRGSSFLMLGSRWLLQWIGRKMDGPLKPELVY
jgi:hypothetical protein